MEREEGKWLVRNWRRFLQDPSASQVSTKPQNKQKNHEISSQGRGGIQLARSLDPGNFILWERFLPEEGGREKWEKDHPN